MERYDGVMISPEPRETAGIVAPPPLIALAAIGLGLVLDWLFPAFVLTLLLSLTLRIVAGVALVAAGAALAVAGRNAFMRSGTNVNPYKPVTALVTTGIYSYVRNPMYVGLALLVAGIGIAFASDWILVMLVVQILTIHFGVIRREERFLAAKFGDEYRQYKEKVPRYGLPI
jgi:protein-S-isoprenylcysteine O-methyltransferase Ste14